MDRFRPHTREGVRCRADGQSPRNRFVVCAREMENGAGQDTRANRTADIRTCASRPYTTKNGTRSILVKGGYVIEHESAKQGMTPSGPMFQAARIAMGNRRAMGRENGALSKTWASLAT